VTRSDSVLSSGAVQGYFLLLLACGAGLLLSIPAGARVAQLMELRWSPSPLVFHLTYVTLVALFGTFRGIAAARWDRLKWKTLLKLAWHVLFAQVILLPYMLFSRALLPGRELVAPLLVLYTTLLAFMLALIALRLALWGAARRSHTFLLQYALVALLFLVPWALGLLPGVPSTIALLSPIGATIEIAGSAPAIELLIAFAFASLLILVQLPHLRHLIRRHHAV